MHGGIEVASVSGLVSVARYGVASSGPLRDLRRVSITLVASSFPSLNGGFALIGSTIDPATPTDAACPVPVVVVVVGHNQPHEGWAHVSIPSQDNRHAAHTKDHTMCHLARSAQIMDRHDRIR
jgi:hypothetical protein